MSFPHYIKHTVESRVVVTIDRGMSISNVSDTKQIGCGKLELQQRKTIREMRRGIISARRTHWTTWPVKPTICGDDDGIPNRVDRIAALGNAIDPHLAYEIFKATKGTLL